MLAIYTRLSREDSESTSIQNQLREGKQFAKDNNFKEIEIYNEGQGISGGAEIENRPQLFQLLQDIRIGKINTVWFRHQDRLERNSATYIIFIGECKKYNCKIFFGDKKFDFEDPNVNLLGQITSAVNQYQKDLQKVKTKKALKDHVSEGKVWSVVAYGYKSVNGYLTINDDEAKIVKEIFDLSLSGIGTDSIAGKLNEKGIPTRKNTKWRGGTIQSILKNTLYKGKRIFSGNTYDAPVIIEPLYWQKVNNNFKNNRNNSGKKVDHKYLLKGLIKCAKCGKNYYGKRRVDLSDNFYSCVGKRYKEIKCTNRGINIDVLENFIWNRFFSDKRILEITKNFLNNDEVENKLEGLRDNKKKFESKLESRDKEYKNALNLLVKSIISEDDFTTIKNRVETEKSDLKLQLKNVKEQISFYNESELTKESVETDLMHLTNASFNDKRELIKKYIESISINYKEPYYVIRIEFKINDYYINEDKFKTDYFGNTEEKVEEVKDKIEQKLVENYIIDRSYNIAIDVCYNYIHPISKKIKKLSKNELNTYAEKVETEFARKHNPIINLEENSIEFIE